MKTCMLFTVLAISHFVMSAFAAPFNPVTADWSAIYTAYPQPVSTLAEVAADIVCLSAFALCSYANCTISYKTCPPVAECGCAGITPVQFPAGQPFNLGSSFGILSKELKVETLAVCAVQKRYSCVNPKNYNTAPFCAAMQPSVKSSGKPTAYGGVFDLISTFNAAAWPTNTTANQGHPGTGALVCKEGGAMALCYSAGCEKKTAWNGMDTTCYCPVYELSAGTIFTIPSNAAGYSCQGQSVDGKLKYLQNGA